MFDGLGATVTCIRGVRHGKNSHRLRYSNPYLPYTLDFYIVYGSIVCVATRKGIYHGDCYPFYTLIYHLFHLLSEIAPATAV